MGMHSVVRWCLLGCVWVPGLLLPVRLCAQGEIGAAVPYRIVLRSRTGSAVPTSNRPGKVAGSQIEVLQPAPDRIQIFMRGGVIAGSEYRLPGMANLEFLLHQEFDIVATKPGQRPAQLLLTGQLIGTMQSSRPQGGVAEQAPACAAVSAADTKLTEICIKPHTVNSTEQQFINDRQTAEPVQVVEGRYTLHQAFGISANAPAPPACQVFPRIVPAASAVFTPEPKFDSRWIYVLSTFNSVPRGNFGFAVELRVVDSPAAAPGNFQPPAPKVEKD
ncbi:MAG TPA: hypothetical protein VFE62_23320 [Gemmataceae bacterium]|nr:hypothetical protein [Gemmataceae bacterium]